MTTFTPPPQLVRFELVQEFLQTLDLMNRRARLSQLFGTDNPVQATAETLQTHDLT